MNIIKKALCLFLTLISVNSVLKAQTLPVGLLENVEDTYRRGQLLGNDSSGSSYMIRPLNISANSFSNFRKLVYSNAGLKAEVYALPIVWQQQINTHHPYGINDGSMVQAKGYQTQFSAGVYAKIGPLSIQLRPEYVYAQNKKFRDITETTNAEDFQNEYAALYNQIDLPSRFGDGSYSRLDWGQSSIRLTFDPVSFGLSNENLWWGPGVRNSLLMSNNAAGFKHLTLNTTRPIKTFIGSFEAQIIGGRLDASGVALPKGDKFVAKPDDWRYLSGIAVTYQPKWLPNLYLGMDRSFIVYNKDMGNKLGDYLPFFSPLEKNAYDTGDDLNADDGRKRDQYISFFGRWVWPEANAEVYAEYGRNDHAYDLRDLLVEAEHSRAYVVGLRKLVPLKSRDSEFIQIGLELTQLETPKTKRVRVTPPWYAHYQVAAGYTNRGQVLGAGIGPGSNLQTLDVSWVKGLKTIGLQLERMVHNNDLLYDSAPYTVDLRRNWVDLGFTGKLDWDFGKFILSSRIAYIKSLNYQYTFERPTAEYTSFWDWNKQDVNNFQVKIGVLYNFGN